MNATVPWYRTRLLWLVGGAAGAAYGAIFCATGNDFRTFYDVGALALARADVYAPAPSTGMYVFYAPYFSLIMMPFALLPRYAAGFLWFCLKAVAFAWLVQLGWREVKGSLKERPPHFGAYLALPLLLASAPIVGEFKLGQVNLFVFLFTVLAHRSAVAGRPWRGAFFFSLALVKVTPWVFVPWFLLRRQWRLLACGVVVGAGWVVALASWFGPDRVAPILRAWVNTSVTNKLGFDSVAYFENQSLQGVAARLATVVPALTEPLLGVPLYRLLWVPVALFLFGVLVLAARGDGFQPKLPRVEFSFVCLMMFLCSPDSRWAHQLQLLAPFTLLAVLAARYRVFSGGPVAAATERAWRAAIRVVLVVGAVFQVLVTRDLVGRKLNQLLRAWSTQFIFVALLTALVAAVLVSCRRGESDEETGPVCAPRRLGALPS